MNRKILFVCLTLAAESSIISPDAKAIPVFTTQDGIVSVQNTNMPFDKGTFFLSGKSPCLVIPENAGVGLVQNSWFSLKSLDFGGTPMMWDIGPADKIALERESDGRKWTSRQYADERQGQIVSSSSGNVPRLVYSFDDPIVTAAGDRYRITFLNKAGAAMDKVRYAVAEIKDGNCIFSDFSFNAGGKDYAPVYAVRLAAKPSEPPKPAVTPKAPEADAPPPEPPKPAVAPKTPEADEPPPKKPSEQEQSPAQELKEYHLSMSIDRPKKTEVARQGNDRSHRSPAHKKDTEPKLCTYSYKGKLSCKVTKEEKAEVSVEAYFIVRDVAKGSKDRIDGSIVVGRYEFGGGNPQSQAIEFKSPAIDSSEAHYVGVIVRAVQNGKPRKVLAIPSNQKWVKVGKQEVVAFEDDGHAARRTTDGSEPVVHTRLEGTGLSTPPGWMDDFYKAQEIAQREGKWMLVTFTGSDWCAPCMRLTEMVLKTVRFQDALKRGGYIPVFVDSPRDQSLLSETCRKQNPSVIRMLKGDGGVPNVNVFDANGRKLVCLGAAHHLEHGVESYVKFFESVDKGLKLINAVKKAHGGDGGKSPEYLKSMHAALMQIDADTLVDLFMDEAESLVSANGSYLKFYPYLEFVAPLEKRVMALERELSEKTFFAMRRDNVSFGKNDDRKKYKRKVFEAGKYSQKFGEILDAAKACEPKISQTAARDRLKNLKLRIFRAMNAE